MSLAIPTRLQLKKNLSLSQNTARKNPPTPPATTFNLGLNLSGMENQYPQPPSLAEMQYFTNRGVTQFRLPIQWSETNPIYTSVGIQPVVLEPLDTTSTYLGAPSATNLLFQSNGFAITPWRIGLVGGTGTITANAGTSPDGTNDASLLTISRDNSSGDAELIQSFSTTSQTYTGFIWVRAYGSPDVGKQVVLTFYDNQIGNWTSNTPITLTNIWTKYAVSGALTAGSASFNIGYSQTIGGIAQTGTVNLLVYQSQVNVGGSALPYSPTTGGFAGYLDYIIAQANSLGAKCLIDIHTFGNGPFGPITNSTIPDFVDLWTRISQRYKGNPGVLGYDLMNEWPNGFDVSVIFSAVQGAISAIRANGDNTTIYIEGTNYSGAWNWVSGEGQPYNNSNLYLLNDPANNLIFSAHCYLDRDSSGTHFVYSVESTTPGTAPPPIETSATIGSTRLTPFIQWCQQHNVRGHIGEIGTSSDASIPGIGGANDFNDWNVALDNSIALLQSNKIPVMLWGAGLDFNYTYGLCIEPTSAGSYYTKDFTSAGVQATQLTVLEKYTGSTYAQPLGYRMLLPYNGSTFAPIQYGSSGVASGNFTVIYGGIIPSGGVTITPTATLMDGTSGGGSFAPSSLTLPAGSNAVATFTYTPSSSNTFQMSAANNGGWDNPPYLGYTTLTDNFGTVTNLTNIFALRRLYAPYIGPALLLQRPSDSAQMAFYFNNRGDLPRQAIQTWAGNINLIPVVTIYDQSPAGNNTNYNTNMPVLSLSNAEGYPEITMIPGQQMTFNSQSYGQGQQTIYARLNAANANILVSQDIYSDIFRLSALNYDVAPNGGATYVTFSGTYNSYIQIAGTFSNLYSTNNIKAYQNGSVITTASVAPFTFAPADQQSTTELGYFVFGGNQFTGAWQEIVIAYDEFSGTLVSAFNSADTTYYSTPLPDSLSTVSPEILGAGPTSLYTLVGTSTPFSGVTIIDANYSLSPTDSVTITLSGAAGTLSGTGLSGSNPYTLSSDTAANITTKLQALVLTSSASLNSTIDATIHVVSSAGTSATDTNTVVTISTFGIETPFAAPAGTFTPINMKGVNIAGGEINGSPIYPTTWNIDYYVSKGFGLMRMPIQPGPMLNPFSLGFSPLNIPYIQATIKPVIDYAFSKNMYVVIDPHTFGLINGTVANQAVTIGTSQTANDAFADWWSRMSSLFSNYPNVIFGLMNEPVGMSVAQWHTAAVLAVDAIRAGGATQLITIPGGANYTGAHDWVTSGNAAAWAGYNGDTANNFVFEMHEYLDSDFSGTHPQATQNGSTILVAATAWLVTNGFKAFLGEFGFAPDPWLGNPSSEMNYLSTATPIVTNGITQGNNLAAYMKANSSQWVAWSYWVSGQEFATPPTTGGYAFQVDPPYTGTGYVVPIVDQPQMAVLTANI